MTPQPLLRARLSSFLSSAASTGLHSIISFAPSPASDQLALVVHDSSDSEGEEEEEEVDNTQLNLSTTCNACGNVVTVPVPHFITAAMDKSAARRVHDVEDEDSSKFRNDFVSSAVNLALAFKNSSIPSMIVNALKWIFVASLYLDAQFSLHQRFAVWLGAVLETLLEIEKEVGLFRNVGSTISVVWEAAIKSTIAFASNNSPDSSRTTNPPHRQRQKSATLRERTNAPRSRQHSANSNSGRSHPSTSAHSRSHQNAGSSHSHPSGKSKVRYGESNTAQELHPKSHLHPTLRRATRSTSSLNSSKSTSDVAFPTSSIPPSYSTSISSSPETRRRRSRSATGGSLEKEQEQEREREREETERERQRAISSTWAGSLRGSIGSVGRSFGRV